MNPGSTVRAEGSGSIAIGGDAINSIFVTGGVNQFFVGRYDRLADAYVSPLSLYRELELENFYGRRWLVAAIDEFIATFDRGYVVVEAEAGMGKTSFMAWLSRECGYAHHFVRLMPDATDVGSAIRNMSAQLIRAWDLHGMAVGGVLPPNAGNPGFFSDVLFEAALKRDATKPSEPIVIAVDGLSEVEARPEQNPLGLPSALPLGVYFVVSQRPEYVPLLLKVPRRVIELRAHSRENLEDMRLYLEHVSSKPELAALLREAKLSSADFVAGLLDKCRGLWLVLYYVLAEIRSGARRPGELETLPVGLWQYYAHFWGRWRADHGAEWQFVDLPLLTTLAAAQEQLSIEQLCDLAGIPERTARAEELFVGPWRSFLEVNLDADRYSIFHETLSEFVAGAVDLSGLGGAERSLVRMLETASRRAHKAIADRYITAWGGLPDGLPALRSGRGIDMDGGYGLRHLVFHLIAGDSDEYLDELLALEWDLEDQEQALARARNAWFEAHRRKRSYGAYARDITLAWRQAEKRSDAQETLAGDTSNLLLELRYALIAASVNTLAGNVPAELLVALLDSGQISPSEAIDLAREAPDPTLRAEALTTLVAHVPDPEKDALIREALASIQAMPDGYWRVGELSRLVPFLDSRYDDDVLDIALNMKRPLFQLIALKLAGFSVEEAADIMSPFGHVPDRVPMPSFEDETLLTGYRRRARHAFDSLAASGRIDFEAKTGREALEVTAFITDPRWRSYILTEWAGRVAEDLQKEILTAALEVSMTIGDDQAITTALARLESLSVEAGTQTEDTEPVAETPGDLPAAVRLESKADSSESDEGGPFPDAWSEEDPDLLANLIIRSADRLDRSSLLAAIAKSRSIDVALRDRVDVELTRKLLEVGEQSTALEMTRDIQDPHWKMLAVMNAVAILAERGDHELARSLGKQILHPTWRAESLGELYPADETSVVRIDPGLDSVGMAVVGFRLAGKADADAKAGLLKQAHDLAEEVPDPSIQARLKWTVVKALSDLGETTVALSISRNIADDYWRSAALIDMADQVPSQRAEEAISIARTILDPLRRALALAPFSRHVGASGTARALAHWREVLHLLSGGTRNEVLSCLPNLLEVFPSLTGPEALLSAASTIDDVRRWWP